MPTGIRELHLHPQGTAKINGKKTGIVETTGCGPATQWTFAFTNVFRGGVARATATT